mmetsp:Transcript_49642/g.118186  ORF Transcript_49642/g.118186 Transcript_49642/m.118186 type:complete len:531 (+) Transcript_49642:104-1696(+)
MTGAKVKVVRVCHCDSCVASGAQPLLMDIEDLVGEIDDDAEVEPLMSTHNCGNDGPVVKVGRDTSKQQVIYCDVSSYEALENMFKETFGDKPFQNNTRNKARRVKYQFRREQDFTAKEGMLGQAFASAKAREGEASQDTRAMSELLVLRARLRMDKPDMKEDDCQQALADAKLAMQLTPHWIDAGIVASDAYEVVGDDENAVSILDKVLSAPSLPEPGPSPSHGGQVQKKAALAWHREDLLAADFTSWSVAAVETRTVGAIGYAFLTLSSMDSRALSSHTFASPIWHVRLRARPELGRKAIVRPYTPLSSQEEYADGKLRMMVKVYPKGVMSRHLAELKHGATLRVSPPVCTKHLPGCQHGLVCIVGGSAITVGLQTAKAAFEKYKNAPIRLVICINSAEDLQLEDEVVAMTKLSLSLQVVIYAAKGTGDKKTAGGKVYWRAGYITSSALNMEVNAKIVLSGPPGLHQAVWALLEDAGIPEGNVVSLDDVRPPGTELFEEEQQASSRPAPPKNGKNTQSSDEAKKCCSIL